jgi:hypothetical protein
MRRFVVLVTVGVLLAATLAFTGPASAQGGCQAFGQSVADDAMEFRPLGTSFVSGATPLNDAALTEHVLFCG